MIAEFTLEGPTGFTFDRVAGLVFSLGVAGAALAVALEIAFGRGSDGSWTGDYTENARRAGRLSSVTLLPVGTVLMVIAVFT